MQRPAAAVVLTVVTLGLLALFDASGDPPQRSVTPLLATPSAPTADTNASDRTAPPAPFDGALRDYLESAVDRRSDEAELTRKELDWRRDFPSPPLPATGPKDTRGNP